MKLKLTGLVAGDVEQAKRQYLYLNATASIYATTTTATAIIITNTTTATKAKATATTTTITTGTTSTVTKAKGTNVKYSESIESVLKQIERYHAHTGCQVDVAVMFQEQLIVLS